MLETIKKLFTPVKSLDADEARAFVESHKAGTFTLLDVRQHREYESEHIPGATLIPLPKLPDSYKDLDPDKPTIVY